MSGLGGGPADYGERAAKRQDVCAAIVLTNLCFDCRESRLLRRSAALSLPAAPPNGYY